jgi:hypothetical protein
MTDIHYGVVQRAGRWIIIGQNLQFGSYAHRSSAIRAAKRLAMMSGPLPVHLHLQTEQGQLLGPQEVRTDP